MVTFTLFFTLGVWLLQQQAELPSFAWAWLLLPAALPIRAATPKLRIAKFLLMAAFACGLGFYHAAWQGEQRLSASLPVEWQGHDIEVIGVVAKLPRRVEHGQRFAFDVEKTVTSGVAVPAHIYLASYSDARTPPPTLHAGERWKLAVRLKRVHGGSNPHAFDFELWALENNLRATGYIDNRGDNLRLDVRAVGYRIETLREAVRDKFDAILGEVPYKGVLTALAIGDQGSIPAAQWQVYTRTGVVHLMSISGLHITMLSGMSFALVYRLWRQSARLTLMLPARKAAAAFALLVAACYSLISGYGVPAQRTLYMVASVAIALWLNRNFSLSQILCIALAGVLIPDPWAVLSPGFWLSFCAVALIFFVTAHRIGPAEGQNSGMRAGLLRMLREYANVQWAMCIGLTPILLGLFGQVSLVSPIANAFAIPLVSLVVVPLALLGAALPFDAPLWLAHIAMDITMAPLQFLSALPQAVWIQHAPPGWSIVLGCAGALYMLLPAAFPSRWLGILMMLPMFVNGPQPPADGALRMIVFDVGQGLSAAVQTRNHALLYDTGPDFSGDADSGNRILVPALRAIGISKLDGAILSHDDIDHTGGTASVIEAMPVGWIESTRPVATMKTVPHLPIQSRLCRDGESWNWDGVSFDMLHPGTDAKRYGSHDNDASCVLRIGTANRHILLAADIEKRGEDRLLRVHSGELDANLLIVPHHGSASSSHADFVAAVLPDYAVFTTGYRNRFGHPNALIAQRYADSGAELLRSDEDGAILIAMNADGISVERYRRTHRRYWTDRG